MSNNILPDIEKNFKLDALVSKTDKVAIWPLIRHRVYFSHLAKTVSYSNKKRTRNPFALLRNFFYGFISFGKMFSYEHYCFENTNKRVRYQGKWFDIYFDAWADKYGQQNCLFIEFAEQKYHSKKSIHSKNIVSDLPLKLLAWGFSKKVSSEIEGAQILQEIKQKFALDIDFDAEIKKQLGEYYSYRWIFKRCKKIKTVFVLSSFSRVPLVTAAKSLGIPVVEAQHGFIGTGHPFYSTEFPFKISYPDVLLSFGNFEKEGTKEITYSSKRIHATGSLHLQLEKEKVLPEELKSIREQYDYIVCLTMQAIKEKELLAMTRSLADSDLNILFFICPKKRTLDYFEYTQHPKYKLSTYPIYDILKISDINITLFSTTAVEAEYLGATTIFYNAGGFSKSYFNTEAMGNTVLEESEALTLDHLINSKMSRTPYFVQDYFKRVKEINLETLLKNL